MLENLNIEVHTIIINDAVDYEYAGVVEFGNR
jgi:hypothetical protein